MDKNVGPLASTIYQRTQKGQVVCAAKAPALQAQFLMWLRLFNGLTSTHTLLALTATSAVEAQANIDKLVTLGLIEQVAPSS